MTECKHGMKSGCSYCHAPQTIPSRSSTGRSAAAPKKRGSSAGLSEKMNDKMTALKKRLKEIRGESS